MSDTPLTPLQQDAQATEAHRGDPDYMTSLARGLLVLQAFDGQRRPLSTAQLAHRTGLARAVVRRCLYTLERLGYVAVDAQRHHVLSSRVLALSHAFLTSSPLATHAPPLLDRLSERTDESCSVAMLEGDEIVYVARSKSTRRIMSVDLGVGSRLPAYCTSMGRVLLAALPADELPARLAGAPWPRRTPRTLTSAAALRRALTEVRQQGYALNDQELEIGLCSIAVPVVDRRGQTVAALNIGSQVARRTPEDLVGRLLPALLAAADELGRLLL